MDYQIRRGLTIKDSDVVNLEDFIPQQDFNPHHIHPFILHVGGAVLGVVFAEHLQDALDEAVDHDKLDHYLVPADDPRLKTQNEDGICRLGNAGEPFDIQTLEVVELTNPPMSFTALLNAAAVGSREVDHVTTKRSVK